MNSTYTRAHITATLPDDLGFLGLAGVRVNFIEEDLEYFLYKTGLSSETVGHNLDDLFGLIVTQPRNGMLAYTFKASFDDCSIEMNVDELSLSEGCRVGIHDRVIGDLRDNGVEPDDDMIYCSGEFPVEVFSEIMDTFLDNPDTVYEFTISHEFGPHDIKDGDVSGSMTGHPYGYAAGVMAVAPAVVPQPLPLIASLALPPIVPPIAPLKVRLIKVPGFNNELFIIVSHLPSLKVAVAGALNPSSPAQNLTLFCILTPNGHEAIPDIVHNMFAGIGNIIIAPDSDRLLFASAFEAKGLKLHLPASIVDETLDEESKIILRDILALPSSIQHDNDQMKGDEQVNELADDVLVKANVRDA